VKGWLIASALALGVVIPIQPLLNAELRRAASSGFLAAGINFGVGLAALLICWAIFRPSVPSAAQIASAPWWAWTGGLLGGAFVVVTMLLAPRLGVVLMLGLILVSQMIASLVIDHFGWWNTPVRPATAPRILGVMLIIAGVVLVQVATPTTIEDPVAEPASGDDPARAG
jgi:transporter family-2 protein